MKNKRLKFMVMVADRVTTPVEEVRIEAKMWVSPGGHGSGAVAGSLIVTLNNVRVLVIPPDGVPYINSAYLNGLAYSLRPSPNEMEE